MIKPILFVVAAMLAVPAMAQDPMAPAAPALPKCTAKVTDSCDQTMTTEKRAMTGEQADARDARNGGNWTPNKRAPADRRAPSAPQ